MKIKFENECVGEKDSKICPIPFSVSIDFPRSSPESKAARAASGQRDLYMVFCPFKQWGEIVKFLKEWHPHADRETALRKISEAMKAAQENYMTQHS